MSSFLNKMLDRAKSWLGQEPPVGKRTDAVRATKFDARIYTELLDEAPALNTLVTDLNRKYDYTEDLVQDVLMQFFQASPLLRPAAEMKDGWLANHGVSVNISKDPDTERVRSYTKHDRYGAAMATIAVGQKVRGFLEQNKELQEAAKEAEAAQQQVAQQQQKVQQAAQAGESAGEALDQADKGAQQAAAAAQGASAAAQAAMGDFDGNGPLTAEQASAQDAAQSAAQAQAAAEAALVDAQADAQTMAEAIEQAMGAADAAQAAADAASLEAQMAGERARQATRQPVKEAIAEAGDQLESEADLFRGWGYGEAEVLKMSFQERADLARRLKGNRLAEYVKHLGRWRVMGSANRAKKVTAARDEVYDVELSGNLPDVLATEYPHLATEPGKLDFLVRLGEGRLLSKKYRGIEKIGKGAIICLVDTSGSMTIKDRHGVPREVWAKGFALAMLDQARAEKRDFVGILFADTDHPTVFRFPGGQGPIEDVLAFTETFLNGGTNFMRPLDLAVKILEEQFNVEHRAKGDLVFITDDDCSVTPAWLAAYHAAKTKLGFRTFGVAVGMPKAGSALVSLSDDVRAVQEFIDPSVVADIVRTV